jgi:hypothetical protein
MFKIQQSFLCFLVFFALNREWVGVGGARRGGAFFN